jgi:hypothetical protein
MVIFQTLFESGYPIVQFSDARPYKIDSVFKWSTSLDRFINKSHKNILFMTKRLSLYHSKTRQISPVFEWLQQNGCQSIQNRTKVSGQQNTISLDNFIIEKCHKKNILHNKMV